MLLMGNNKTSILIACLFMLFIFVGLHEPSISVGETPAKQEVKKEVTQQNNPYANAQISTKIIPAANKTFGYEIIVNGRILVRQLSIPALPGNDGFATTAKAQKVADFVVKKIRKNEMPPTVTIEDLSKMDVLK